MNEFLPLASETFNDRIYGVVPQDTLSRQDKLALLLFAAGQRPEVPVCFSSSPAQATSLLRRHRVLGRALKRIEETGSTPEADAQAQAQAANEHVRELFHKREQTLARFVASFCSGIDVVHMKGQSAYYRSGDPAHIRDSNDMDLCLSQPTVLRERLRQVPGLFEHSTNGRLPAHEFLNITFEDLDFDLHKYIPVWRRTSPNLVAAPSRACDIPFATSEARITIDDVLLAPHLITVGGQSLVSPNVTLAAVISLVSVHRDFIMHCASHTRARSPLRMSDVLELRDMLDHPQFDAGAFAEAVRFHQVFDQLGWFGRLHETFLGDLRLLTMWREFTGNSERPETVHRLVAHGFWMNFDQDPERDLVARPVTADLTVHNQPIPVMLADGATAALEADDPANGGNGVWSVGGMALDGRDLRVSRTDRRIDISFYVGADITDACSVYFECDGEMLQWDNTQNSSEMARFASTPLARASLVSFGYSDGRFEVSYRPPGDEDFVEIVVAVGIPQLPWSVYAGWIAALRIEFT